MPDRIRLSRARGWRLPASAVKVDRSTRFGNPFIVGQDGTAIECLYLYGLLVSGYMCVSHGAQCARRQEAALEALRHEKKAGWATLRGKHLACWCRIGAPCHGDLLIEVANGNPSDLADFLARYGYRFEAGRPVRVEARA